jgi:hypothetical protein
MEIIEINAIAAFAATHDPHQGKPCRHSSRPGRPQARWLRAAEPDSRALLAIRNNRENPSSATIPH